MQQPGQPKKQVSNPRVGSISDRVARDRQMQIIREEEQIRALLPDREVAPERRRYPESEFRRHFLPVFSGEAEKNLPPDYTPERLHMEAHDFWMRVAGGPNSEVDVVNASGQTVFTVPAIMDTSTLKVSQPRDSAGLRALNREVLEKAPGLPHVANRQMEVGLELKLAYMTSAGQSDMFEARRKMSKIREYYGLPKPVADDKSPSAVASKDNLGEMSFDD